MQSDFLSFGGWGYRHLLPVLVITVIAIGCDRQSSGIAPSEQPQTTVAQENENFRDLNKNGTQEPYENPNLDAATRAADLVSRMTLEEKAGAMLHGSLQGGPVAYNLEMARTQISGRHVNSLITRLSGTPAEMAEQNNLIQAIAEDSRLGIPLTISTDPRNHFQVTEGATVESNGYSQWPEIIGFASLGDENLVRQFADIARQEYRAVGIHMGLSPQADLSTEPRWARINGTFGEDAELAGKLVKAYVEGFQNGDDGLGADSVALVVKHWVGYGAAEHGYDSHNYYGRYAVFPGDNFEYHVLPFEGAFDAGVAGVMPTYSILRDLEIRGHSLEQVGAGFSHYLLTDLLRGQYGFDGVILSDWAITRDCPEVCIKGEHEGQTQTFATLSTAWGVLDLSMTERFARGVSAGIDQFGGTEEMQALADTVRQGMVEEQRIDESVRRIMEQKFRLGLFENPYVDASYAASFVGNNQFQGIADEAQRKALVLLENREGFLPIQNKNQKVWLHGIAAETATAFGFETTDNLDEADFAIIKASTPFETLHPNYAFGAMQHEGDLSFHDGNPEYEAIKEASAKVPTIVSVYLDRPAILTNVQNKVQSLIGNFGISDQTLFEVLTGEYSPQGRLPYELPSSMEAVEKQFSDVPYDSEDPLYPFGYGLDYR